MTAHAPIVAHWPGTARDPEEIRVTCTCWEWEYTSQESAGGPVEPWGDAFADHLSEMDDDGPDCGEAL